MTVLGFAGSLRRASYNRGLIRASAELAPPGIAVEVFDVGGLPFYNQDVEDAGEPAGVVAFKRAIARADALLVATPEYNHGVPGVLKNAIDWASRPPDKTPLKGKPASIMGATPGQGGTIRAQGQLRQAFVFTQTCALLQPEVLVAKAHEKFDKDGRLTDETTRGFVKKHLEALREWTLRLR
jgi:chromate reductase